MTDQPQCPELAQFLAQNFAPKPKPKPEPKEPDRWADYVLWKPGFEGEEPPF